MLHDCMLFGRFNYTEVIFNEFSQNKMQYQTETYFNPLHLNGDMNLPPTLQPGNYERDLPQKHSTSLEDSQASAKKKVTIVI